MGPTALGSPFVDNIVLTGFMGTGKTSVGRELGTRLGMEFVDTDEIIESRHGPIDRIFAENGEQAFRRLEREVASELGQRRGMVIATGGRMLLDPVNLDELTRNGRVFCLVASPEEIHRRVTTDEIRSERPLLGGDDPQRSIAELMAERSDRYARFPQIETDHRDVVTVADEIVRLWLATQTT